jgi:scyllo-inositol 2-dehydrogenase (NADP+)
MIRVGLAGYGLAGATFHAPLIRACERMNLAAVLTSQDVPLAVRSVHDMLRCADLVVVATPNATHFDLAKAALEAGKHVVVDKPFTATLEQADALIAMADAAGRKISVFHNRRWDGDFLTVQELLPELGTIRLFEARWDRFRLAIRDNWKEVPDEGTGLLADLGAHLVDQALQLFGMPDSVHADLAVQRDSARVNDYFEVTLHYGAMRAILSASTLVAEPRPRFAIHGTGGSLIKSGLDRQEDQLKARVDPRSPEFGHDPLSTEITRPTGERLALPTASGRYLEFYHGIAAAILDGAAMPVDAREARDVMQLLTLAAQSARKGRTLSVVGR